MRGRSLLPKCNHTRLRMERNIHGVTPNVYLRESRKLHDRTQWEKLLVVGERVVASTWKRGVSLSERLRVGQLQNDVYVTARSTWPNLYSYLRCILFEWGVRRRWTQFDRGYVPLWHRLCRLRTARSTAPAVAAVAAVPFAAAATRPTWPNLYQYLQRLR